MARKNKRRGGKPQAKPPHKPVNGSATQMPKITLAIDIGGTGIKMMRLDETGMPLGERIRELTPRPALPESVMVVLKRMLEVQEPFDRVSVGFPGVVSRGVVFTAPNLSTEAWENFALRTAIADLTNKPVRVVNDADLQGYGVITGDGVELALTLGTGLGAALFSDGHLVANLELGHHPFGDKRGRTYEERVSDAERKRIKKKKFRERVASMLEQIQPIFNPDHIYIGGGNAKRLDVATLPENVKLFTNQEGLRGGLRLWDDALAK